jgi:hypothetical protein
MDGSAGDGAPGARDPSRFSRWVQAHPLLWGVASGALFLLIGLIIFGHVLVAVAGGILIGGLNAFLWRSKGPASRWRQSILRRFPR